MIVVRQSAMWVLIILSVLIALTTAQKECSNDADCMSNQYCYTASLICVNYTVCSGYNREESLKPSRDASQCGKCLKGYSPELLIESSAEADSCKKGHDDKEQGNTATRNWVICGSVLVAFLFVIGILYAVHVILRCKFSCEENPAADRETEKPGLLMVENGLYASAPPPPSPIQNRNNNKYDDAEETNPLSSPLDYRRYNFMAECRPVKAQGFHPPEYVRTDPSYNPGDTQTTQPMFSPPDIDEETIPSDWTPGPSASGGTLPAQPFAAIAEEVQDNTTNTALQRLTCPSPSTNQDGHENRQNNNSSGDSGGFNYNNTNGNARGNPNSPALVQVQQIVNIIHHGSNIR